MIAKYTYIYILLGDKNWDRMAVGEIVNHNIRSNNVECRITKKVVDEVIIQWFHKQIALITIRCININVTKLSLSIDSPYIRLYLVYIWSIFGLLTCGPERVFIRSMVLLSWYEHEKLFIYCLLICLCMNIHIYFMDIYIYICIYYVS